LDGYVPTLDDKAKLIASCEALERKKPSKMTANKPKAKGKKFSKSLKIGNKGQNGSAPDKNKSFYCTEHGKNPTHATTNCCMLKYCANKAVSDVCSPSSSF
jgi:hypothetical protein